MIGLFWFFLNQKSALQIRKVWKGLANIFILFRQLKTFNHLLIFVQLMVEFFLSAHTLRNQEIAERLPSTCGGKFRSTNPFLFPQKTQLCSLPSSEHDPNRKIFTVKSSLLFNQNMFLKPLRSTTAYSKKQNEGFSKFFQMETFWWKKLCPGVIFENISSQPVSSSKKSHQMEF